MAKRIPAGVIPTTRVAKGDFVVGHSAYAIVDSDLPAVPGKISAVSASGHSVTFDVGAMHFLGIDRLTEWTWREKSGAYQQKGVRSKPGSRLVRTSAGKLFR